MTIEMPNAQLDWDDQGRPHSRLFDDVYFSDKSGLEETRYVFIEQNALRERFAALPANAPFVIGETGFGTGLNFLCAWQLFDETAPPDARLHFISVEKYPLTREDLQRALGLWPELATYSEQLLASYFAIHPGFQTLSLANGRVTLTLLIGDVLEQLPQLDAQVDAWFLDGFAPAKNPDMWTPELFAQLARLAAPDATISTFTSTGWVRRALNEAGFKMLDSHVGAIYGDSINRERAGQIIDRLAAKGFASTNVVFGVGSFTYQFNTRDTFMSAVKATWAQVDGVGYDLQKDPVTDGGTKKSARGRLAVTRDGYGALRLIEQATPADEAASELQPVWADGEFVRTQTFAEVREVLAAAK